MRVLRSGFNVGEVSPLLAGRGDLASLNNACVRLRNAYVRTTGGAFQRPGFLTMGRQYRDDTASWLLPFSFAQGVSYRIELSEKTARFWLDDRLCITQPVASVEVSTPVPVTGGGTLERWVANWGTTVGQMVTFAESHAPTTTAAGSAAPVGTGSSFGKSIQRVRAWFVPPTTGVVKFRARNIDDVARMRLEPVAFGTGSTAGVMLSLGLGTATMATGVAVDAQKSYWVEFMIGDSNPPSGGIFEFSVDGGAWVAVGTEHLAASAVGEIPPDELPERAGVASAVGDTLRLQTPWSAAEVRELQYVQANDVTWLAHGSHWPERLIRYGREDWRIGKMPVLFPPIRDPNANTLITLRSSALSGDVALTATGKVFDAGDVGGYYEISHRRDLPFSEINLDANRDSANIRIVGKWEVFTYGKWTGVLKLYQRRKKTGAIDLLRTWKSNSDNNVQANGEVGGDQELFLRYSGSMTGDSTPRATLSALDAVVRGLVQIKAVASPTSAQATVIRPLHSTEATIVWAEGAWSTRRGFPAAVTIHEQRIWFAGTKSEPQKGWASAIGRFDDFERTSLDDSSFAYQIASQNSNPIVSLMAQEGLVMLTTGDEWVIDGGDSPSITAAKLRAKRRSGIGSARIQPILVGSVIFFVQQGSRILNEYAWDYQQNNFEGQDLTELSEHFGGERIRQIAWAQNPHSVLWAITEGGSLLSLTYRRRSGVIAWAKHSTKHGEFETVCVTPGVNGIHEVTVGIARELPGGTVRTVEKFDPAYWDKLLAGDSLQLCVADGAKMVVFENATNEVTGLQHLEGLEISALVDGAVVPPAMVTGGKVTLSTAGKKIVVGLPPVMELQPYPVELQMDTGATMGRKFKVSEVDLKLWQSGLAKYANSPDVGPEGWFDVSFRDVDHPTGVPVPLRSWQPKLPISQEFQNEIQVILKNDGMLPLNVLSMVMQLNVYGS